jgi:3-hydroxyisobutyrate dehydrogenase
LSKVAWIGTGLMGAPMARNLVDAGHEVRAWNRTPSKAQGLGATVADSPAGAVEGADVVVTMLADGPAVEAAMEGVELTADQIWWQCSTVGVEWISKLAAAAGPAAFVDGPVSGTKGPAEQGQLTILASGKGRERLGDVFAPLAAKVVDLGDEVGAGTKLKLVLNQWVISFVESLAETIALAEGLGIEPVKIFDSLDGGPLYAAYMRIKGQAMVDRAFEPSFSLKLAHKDAGLVLEAASELGLDLPLPAVVEAQMRKAIELGHGEDDLSATFLASCPELS